MADTKNGKLDKAKNETVKRESATLLPTLMREVEDKLVVVYGQKTLLDRDVAALYGVETFHFFLCGRVYARPCQ